MEVENRNNHWVKASRNIMVIDVIRTCPFDLACAIKYIVRFGMKDDIEVEYAKIRDYLNWSYESYLFDSKPYDKWFSKYRLLLKKFPELESFECGNCLLFITHLDTVAGKIYENFK